MPEINAVLLILAAHALRSGPATPQARAQATAPPSSAYLAMLPDGDLKRRFIVNCTGCHLLDARVAFPEGTPRTAQSWRGRIDSMHVQFGPGSGFPIIADPIPADSLARWLAAHLRSQPNNGGPASEASRVREYLLPAPQDLPHDVLVAGGGRVVVTGMFTDRMYTLDAASGRVESEPIPFPMANPRAHHIDPDGTLWVVLGMPNAVARRRPDGTWQRTDVGFYAHSIARDSTGVWINGHFTGHPSRIAHINASSGAITRESIASATRPGVSPIPYEIRTGPDGRIWMSELQGGRVVAFDPRTRSSRSFAMPSPHSAPRRLDVARDGRVWIPLYADNALLELDPSSGLTSVHRLPDADALPYVARVDDARGAVWVGTAASDAVYRFDIRLRRFERIALPSRGAMVRHLDIDPRTGDVWLAYGASPGSLSARIARVR